MIIDNAPEQSLGAKGRCQKMKIVQIASDHAGFELKGLLAGELAREGWQVTDHGPDSGERCDYPQFARRLCASVISGQAPGILICGTGIGMSMCANRFANIRAALCATEMHARMARLHNDANVLCLGSRITGAGLALAIVKTFLETPFEMGRHRDRIDQFSASGLTLP